MTSFCSKLLCWLSRVQATEEELTKHVNRQVANHKMIRGGVLIRDSIPRNSMGKLVRRTMRKWALEQFEKKKDEEDVKSATKNTSRTQWRDPLDIRV